MLPITVVVKNTNLIDLIVKRVVLTLEMKLEAMNIVESIMLEKIDCLLATMVEVLLRMGIEMRTLLRI